MKIKAILLRRFRPRARVTTPGRPPIRRPRYCVEAYLYGRQLVSDGLVDASKVDIPKRFTEEHEVAAAFWRGITHGFNVRVPS